MARLPRKFLKVFARDANNNGVFGSAADNTKILSNDVETIQSKPAWLTGWLDAVIGTRKFPTLEEFQSCNYVNTSQISYLFQEGISEWNAETEYYQKSIVKKTGTYEIYGSITDANVGNDLSDDTNWQFLMDLSLDKNIPYGVTTGSGNTYSVTTNPIFDSLVDGEIFVIKANFTNNGSATLNPNSIGDLDIYSNGSPLSGGEIVSGGFYILSQDFTDNRVHLLGAKEVQATETIKGIAEIATTSEMIAQLDNTRIATPLGINRLFGEIGRQSLAVNGYQIFPNGLILQWGTESSIGPTQNRNVIFPIEYPNMCFGALISKDFAIQEQRDDTASAFTKTGFIINNGSPANTANFFWASIGF